MVAVCVVIIKYGYAFDQEGSTLDSNRTEASMSHLLCSWRGCFFFFNEDMTSQPISFGCHSGEVIIKIGQEHLFCMRSSCSHIRRKTSNMWVKEKALQFMN